MNGSSPASSRRRSQDAPPRVSVVIPCHNSELYIEETVSSVLDQDLRDFEIVLVDDGSRDATVDVVRALIQRLPARTIRLIEQANRGQAGARNTAIDAARGRYILPLDSDDLIADGMLAHCADRLDADPGLDLVYGDREDFGDVSGVHASGRFELDRLKYFNQLAYCGMYRRALWQRVGGYQINVSGFDDWNFWIAAAAAGARAEHVPRVLMRHRRRRPSQMWSMLERYEKIYSQIVLNNAGCYSQREVEAASLHLHRNEPSSMASLARLVFLGLYYRDHGKPDE